MAVMFATGTSALSPSETAYVMLHSWRGVVMLVAILLLAATYPKFGFVRRVVSGDVTRDRKPIVALFERAGFELVGEEDGVLTFRAKSLLKRLNMLYEDEITVTQSGESVVIEGNRRGVAQVYFRWQTMCVENE